MSGLPIWEVRNLEKEPIEAKTLNERPSDACQPHVIANQIALRLP